MRETVARCFRDTMLLMNGRGPVDDTTLTSLVQVFVAGWADAAHYYDINTAALEAFLKALEDTGGEAFQAGPEWRWEHG